MSDNFNSKRKSFLDNLPPGLRKVVYLGVAGTGIVTLCYALTSDVTPKDRNNEIKNVLTDKKTDDLGIESLLAQIKISNDNFREVKDKLERQSKEYQLIRDEYSKNQTALNKINALEKTYGKSVQTFETQMKALSDRITELSNENSNLHKELEQSHKAAKNADNSANTGNAGDNTDFIDKPVNLNDPNKLFAEAPTPELDTLADGEGVTPVLTTSVITEDLTRKETKRDKKEPEIYIPSGSILRGVLLAGLDAPTGTNAKKDPFPVNVRIQKDAILPNGYSADVKECFLLMSGYGELSSERALLRGINLSCIKEDGGIIEAKLPSYAAGEDGKAGLRGRLVSKTGSLIMKTMIAGFASGISSAFDVNMTPTINTSSNGTVSYEKVYNKEALRGAGAKGVAKAFDKLSDYYMGMADQMFPIIEVDAGRTIDIVVTQGATLTTVRDKDGNAVTPGVMESDTPEEITSTEPQASLEG